MKDELQAKMAKSLAESIDINIVNEEYSEDDKALIEGLKQFSNTPMALYKFLCDWRYLIILVNNSVEEIKKWKEWIENIEETAYKAYREKSDSHNGIECNCRIENRAHEITVRSTLNDIWTRQKLLEEKVNTIESTQASHVNQLSVDAFVTLLQRIEPIEQMQKDMLNMPNIIWQKYNKTPYKCPVCEGNGHRTKPNYQDGGDITFECKSCEGKGIVWG